MTQRIVLASRNAKKIVEMDRILDDAGLHVEVVGIEAFDGVVDVPEVPETEATFEGNALLKARAVCAATGVPAVADDSGLCVDALGGAPGVISAHYAPVPEVGGDREALRRAQDAANNALLLQRLADQTDDGRRRAAFVSTLVALRHAADPEPLLACGRWVGRILQQPRGSGGFGYDPLMFIPGLDRSVAELDAATKNRVSHRALAAAQMRERLREAWALGKA